MSLGRVSVSQFRFDRFPGSIIIVAGRAFEIQEKKCHRLPDFPSRF